MLEQRIRKKRQLSAVSVDSDEDEVMVTSSRKKRQSSAISIDSDDDGAPPSGRSSSAARDSVLAESESGNSATDTPMSSPHAKSSQTKRRKVSSEDRASYSTRSSCFEERRYCVGR